MGDLENRVNSALAATLARIPWVARLQRGTITLDDIEDHTLMAGVAEITLTLAELLPLLAREVDEARGSHDFGE